MIYIHKYKKCKFNLLKRFRTPLIEGGGYAYGLEITKTHHQQPQGTQ